MTRLWDKGEPLDDRILRYTAGEDHVLDDRLVAYDVVATIAHARMLHERSYLSASDFDAVREGLEALAEEHARGDWRVSLEEEDCHTALERRLTERIGEAAGRVHLGRSRNDQVLAALRLFLRDAIESLACAADEVGTALDDLGRRHEGVDLPGYTHLQRAMPSSVEAWAGGFATEIRDDAAGLRTALRRVNKNPLGSAAGYGTRTLDLDRGRTRELLDFAEVQDPVTAVQLSRGKAEAGALFEATLLMQDLGRLASDLVLFASREFGLVTLPDAMTTGSSIMPQKRNPDVFELVRGRTATVTAALHEVLGVVTKLPSGYHRDLQLIKAPLFRGLDTTMETTTIVGHAVRGIAFRHTELTPELFAADEAYRLVCEEGIPFREAYRRIGKRFSGGD